MKREMSAVFCCSVFLYCLFAVAALNAQVRIEQHEKQEKVAEYDHLINYYRSVNTDSSVYYAEQGLLYAINKKYPDGEASMTAQLGKIDQAQGRLELAKHRMAYALNIYKNENNPHGLAEMNDNLGQIEVAKGNYKGATQYLMTALKLHDQFTDNGSLLQVYVDLGWVYLQTEDTTNAQKFLYLAKDIAEMEPVNEATISLYNYLGILYNTEGDKARALKSFQRGVAISEKPEYQPAHVESLLCLGAFYKNLGDTKTAIQYLDKGLVISRQKNLSQQRAELLLEKAGIVKANDPEAAIAYLQEAMSLSQKLHSLMLISSIYEQLEGIYEKKGVFKEALVAFKKQHEITDSISGKNNARELASLVEAYELEKSNIKVQELELLNIKIENQFRIIIFISVIIVVALAVMVVFYFKSRQLNYQLSKSEQELQTINKTKDKLFSVIGHDLRGPVAQIPAILELYEDDEISAEEKQELLEAVKEHSKATSETLDKLLMWGKSLLKGVSVQPVKFNTHHFINESIQLKKTAAGARHIAVLDFTTDHEVLSDQAHFDFVIRNLLSNAIKFTKENGKIEIFSDAEKQPGFVVFSVKDNGVGIDKEKLPHIFEPFNSNDGTAHEKGTGMGLMLCKEFALQNGGDLWVESESGRGSIFYFSVKKA